MPVCPNCHDEYQPEVSRCVRCDVELIPDGAPLPPRIDRLLGTFHPIVAERIIATLVRRRIGHATADVDGRVEIRVDRDFRDDLRAELAVNWTEIVSGLDPEEMYTVLAEGGQQPGWYDAPSSAWVDRSGRLQVDGGDEEEDLRDAARVWGPSMLALGAVLALFGWYAEGSAALLLLGIATALVGLFLPR